MSIRLKAIELADLLGVAQASVSGAAINDHLCAGYPVSEWADKNIRGRILGYDVPDEVFRQLTTGETNKKTGDKDTISSKEKELRKKIREKWYSAIVGLSIEEIEKKEKEIREKFGSGIAVEEFERAKSFELNMREVDKIFAELEAESESE